MYDLTAFGQTEYLVLDRIHDLYATASELRADRRRSTCEPGPGLLARTRSLVGRRIVALGSAVAGQRA